MSKKKRGEERMKEEDNILKKVGKKNSFKVPDARILVSFFDLVTLITKSFS